MQQCGFQRNGGTVRMTHEVGWRGRSGKHRVQQNDFVGELGVTAARPFRCPAGTVRVNCHHVKAVRQPVHEGAPLAAVACIGMQAQHRRSVTRFSAKRNDGGHSDVHGCDGAQVSPNLPLVPE